MKVLLIIIFILLSIFSSNELYSQYSGGSGTSGDPYQVATTADLISLSNTSSHWSSHFILTQNIEFNSDETLVDWDGDGSATWDAEDQLGFSPIGNISTSFAGVFDGQNYNISNLFINRSSQDYIGLFGLIQSSGERVKNIGLSDVNITGNANVGGLAGNINFVTIQSCYSTGNVKGILFVGGFIGNSQGQIYNCYSTCNIEGSIGSFGSLGGFIGRNTSTIENCYSTGSVSGGDQNIGGFVGSNHWNINYCYSTGNVSGGEKVGGFGGESVGQLTRCYSLGGVSGDEKVGGFVGENQGGLIIDCYSTGFVIGLGYYVGGLVGSDDFSGVSNSFWDTQTSGKFFSAGGTGKTTAQMKTQSTFSAWDFGTDETDWVMSSNISFFGYPTLRWTGGFAVAPTGSPKEIATLPNLVWIAENSSRWADSYIQTANLNMWTTPSWDGNKGWSPIGNITTQFTGVYDGQNNTISNLNINRPLQYYVGLFGYIYGIGVKVNNIGLIDVNIIGYSYIGGLVGVNGGATINYSYSMGKVSGSNSQIGGLIGNNSGIINDCYSIVTVNGQNNIGGFVATNSGTINNCYSTGSITGSANIGGLIVNNSGSVINSFWDTETSNQATSAGGTGKTIAQMKTKSTFTNATWDFKGIWNINSSLNNGYPYHRFSYRIYVDATRPDDAGTADSWSKAKKTFQAALDLAISGYEIWVKAGTYKPSYAYDLTNTSRYYHFRMKNFVEIFGGFAGTETLLSERTDFGQGGANETTLSGDLSGNDDFDVTNGGYQGTTGEDNCYHVFYHPNGLGLNNSAILDGFTIKGGNANANVVHYYGGGIYNHSIAPTITNVTISNCYAFNGGGGMFNYISSPTLNNVTIANNYTAEGGGGVFNYNNSSPTLNNVTIVNNYASNKGGGIYNFFDSSPSSNNSILWDNSSQNGNQIFIGDGTTTLNHSCYSNEANDVVNSGGTFIATNNNITSIPKFLDASNGDYRILGNSPCINTGNNSYNSETYDIRGQARKNGTIDMGAYEWTSETDKSNPVYVSEDYSNGNPNGFGITHYNNLTTALTNATTDATVNITNYSHVGDVDMTGRTFIVGTQDFDVTGNLSGGQVQVTNTGKLIMKDLAANTTKSFPITDGTYNYTMTITTADVNSPDISVRISNLNPTGSINSDFWDIDGPANLNATVTLRVDKASIAPKTLGSNTQLRYRNSADTRYVPVNGNNFSIEEFDTYYIITITGVNGF